MREKFWNLELLAVKRRWELVTIIYAIVMVLYTLTLIGDYKAMAEVWNSSGDNFVVLIVFSILGLKWASVHHYSLVAICVARTIWCFL